MRRLNSKGYTLTEMVVVLMLIAILSTMILTHFNGTLAQKRLHNQMDMVLSDLRWAQQIAKTRETLVIFSFYQNQQKQHLYQVRHYGNSSMGEIVKQVNLMPTITINFAGVTTVEFTGDGTIRYNGHLTLTHQKQSGKLYFYQTGRMRISYD